MIQVILATLALLIIAGAGYSLYRIKRNASFGMVNKHWTEFSTAASTNDQDAMKEALAAIVAIKPSETLAASRLESLKTGIADENDPQMCMITTRLHLKNNQMNDAVREAKKRLTKEPNDWLCNLILAKDAITRDDKLVARHHLDMCSAPNSAIERLPLGLVLFAIDLREGFGLDVVELRSYIFSRVIPNLRNQNLSQVQIEGKIQIIFSFASSVATIPETSLDNTLQYWAFVSQLADLTMHEAIDAKNEQVLKQLATLQSLLNFCASRYLKQGLILADEAATMTKECDVRAESSWRALMNVAPRNVNGYVGVATQLIKMNQYPEAEAIIKSGIEKAGPYPQILQLYIKTASQRNKPEEALRLAVEIAQKNASLPETWQVVVEAAIAAKRRDVAIMACENARKSKRDIPWIDAVEASLWLEYGDAHKALQLLSKIPESIRTTSPFIAKAYTKSLCKTGSDVLIPDFIKQTLAESELKNRPELAKAVLSGLSEGELTSARADYLAEQLERMVTHWASLAEIQIEGRWDLANAQFLAAKLATPIWETTRLEQCLRNYQALSKQYPDDPRSFTRMAILNLFGLKKPQEAMENVNELRKLPTLPPESHEVIGAVLLANKKYEEAQSILELVCRSPSPSTFALTQLALTYHYRGDNIQAKRTLQQASVLRKSAWEHEVYLSVAKLIQESS